MKTIILSLLIIFLAVSLSAQQYKGTYEVQLGDAVYGIIITTLNKKPYVIVAERFFADSLYSKDDMIAADSVVFQSNRIIFRYLETWCSAEIYNKKLQLIYYHPSMPYKSLYILKD